MNKLFYYHLVGLHVANWRMDKLDQKYYSLVKEELILEYMLTCNWPTQSK